MCLYHNLSVLLAEVILIEFQIERHLKHSWGFIVLRDELQNSTF